MKNKFEIGDRVICNNTNSKGIVHDLDFIKNEGGFEARAKIHWTDCSTSLIGKLQDGWVCENNLTKQPPRVITNPSSPGGGY